MIARAVLCAALITGGFARGQDPAQPSRVRRELAAVLGGRAPASPGAELRDYTGLLSVEEKPKAKARLDALDRAALSPVGLHELGEAYVLLGYFDAGAAAGRTIQDREPSGTQGFKLAAFAKLQAKDYAAAEALAREALKLDPKDQDAAALLQSAAGRGAPSAPSVQAPSPRGVRETAAPRTSPIFAVRGEKAHGAQIPLPASDAQESEPRVISWVKRKIDESSHAVVRTIDRFMNLQPGEENTALTGARYGAIAGAGLGIAGGGVVGSIACSPALVSGVPYGACVVAGSAGGLLFLAPTLACVGGVVSVGVDRVRIEVKKNFGFDKGSSPEAE